jgi:hypothetical protein
MPIESNTPNNSFRYPTAANNGSDFATGLQDLANDIDGMWQSGTLVARPAANAVKPGTTYRATDTGQVSWSNGTIWRDVGIGGDWTPIMLSTNWITVAGYYAPAVRMAGSMAQLRGVVLNNTGGSSQGIGTMPPAAVPASKVIMPAPATGAVAVGTILTISGNFISTNSGINSGIEIGLDGLFYSLC